VFSAGRESLGIPNSLRHLVASPGLQGDSACAVESAYVFINKPDSLGVQDSVRVLVVRDLGSIVANDDDLNLDLGSAHGNDLHHGNSDAKLLVHLIAENDWSPSACDRVLAFQHTTPNVSAAMPQASQ
jgi:hypothetical protein